MFIVKNENMILPSKEFWEVFKRTPGALSCTEAIAIMNIAAQVPESSYLELGTYRGKSAMSALVSLKNGSFDLVDPEFSDQLQVSDEVMKMASGGNIAINIIKAYSTDIIENYNHLSYVFVDSGSHQDGLPMKEVILLENRVASGGIVAFHDFKNQFREPAEAAEYLVNTGKYEWVDIQWDSIIHYVKENNLEEGNDSWHIYEDRPFPNFVGAIKRK